jgi:prepilin-type N-terminal cleavage/methylation domain-containing protein
MWDGVWKMKSLTHRAGKKMHGMHHRNGFTLIELSIAIAVIGLIVGGIITGASLFRSSEIQAISRDAELFKQAYFKYQAKYNAIPGDHSEAFAFFGSACGTNAQVAAGSYAGCNGNGDGQLANGFHEGYKMWVHVTLAGMLEGTYSGAPAVDTTPVAGTDGPRGPGETVWAAWGRGKDSLGAGSGWDFQIVYDVVTLTRSGNAINSSTAILVEEAFTLDKKVDDGKPLEGKMWGHGVPCQTSTDINTAAYNLTDLSQRCNVSFVLEK